MRFIRPIFGAILLLLNQAAFAWQLNLENDSEGTAQVAVQNELRLSAVVVYLAWFNLDTGAVQSWSMNEGWQADELSPIAPHAFTSVEPFAQQTVTTLPALCDSDERCFLALIALPEAADVLDSTLWQASAVLPLSVKAGQERLPGQQFFLSDSGISDNFAIDDTHTETAGDSFNDIQSAPSPTMAAPEADAEKTATTSTEKPDIFRLVGTRLYYANGQAEKFQIIDVSNPNQPRLVAETRLKGNPRELYVMPDYIVLMQNDYETREAGTRLTVLQLNADETIETVAEKALTGHFIESRRRNQVIYAAMSTPYQSEEERSNPELADITTIDPEVDPIESGELIDCVNCGSRQTMTINALTLAADGQLTVTDQALLRGYDPKLAIYNDYLILASANPRDWRSSLVQGFLLTDATNPLIAFDTIQVPGRIPSEFHLNIKEQQLRVVYGPANRDDGSHLAIFDLSQQTPSLLGKVEKIAPGEDLFATRFVDEKAFVVTYERTDPLWVIDLSDPRAPKIIGELHVPGWSEKLFFHEDRLFAVGIHDVPTENEAENLRVRRVAMSLFDVSDPTNPTLINRVVPLAEEVRWSSSEALDDERALLLDWAQSYAALPISSWQSEAGNYLQIVSFADGQLKEAGRVPSLVNLRRSVELNPNTLAALGDQALMTVQWGNGTAQVLAELELAVNLNWVTAKNGNIWAAAQSEKGYHRFYQYTPNALEQAAQTWSLPRGYNAIALGDTQAVFYNVNPLAFQTLDLSSGQLSPAQVTATADKDEDYYWYSARSKGFVAGGAFHIGEEKTDRYTKPEPCESGEICILPALETLPTKPEPMQQWTLKSWPLQSNTVTPITRSIPGRPVGFTANGQLVTEEPTSNRQLRLNLLTLTPNSASLVKSHTFDCLERNAQTYWNNGILWVNCSPAQRYYVQAPDEDEANNLTSHLYRLDPMQHLSVTGEWTFEWTFPAARRLVMASEDVVMLQKEYYYFYDIPYDEARCEIVRVGAAGATTSLAQRDYCPNSTNAALQAQQLIMTQGFAGFDVLAW